MCTHAIYRELWGNLGHAAAPAPAQRTPTLRLPQRARNMLDLTHIQTPEFPTWPGTPKLVREPLYTHEASGFYANRWQLYEHHATHMDAPVHFIKGKPTLDQLTPAQLVGYAVVVDIRERAQKNPDAQLTADDLRQWERRYGRIPDGAIVFMLSGWGARARDEQAYRNADSQGVMHFPGFAPDAAEMLVKERNILGIGVDTLSLDFGASTTFAVHKMVLEAGKWGLENVANLEKLPPSGAVVFVGALRLQNASGGPVRLIALW